MLMYHLFYHVTNSNKKSYSETKVFQFKKNALEEALELNQCSNVDLVYIREVDVQSLGVEILKGSEEVKYAE